LTRLCTDNYQQLGTKKGFVGEVYHTGSIVSVPDALADARFEPTVDGCFMQLYSDDADDDDDLKKKKSEVPVGQQLSDIDIAGGKKKIDTIGESRRRCARAHILTRTRTHTPIHNTTHSNTPQERSRRSQFSQSGPRRIPTKPLARSWACSRCFGNTAVRTSTRSTLQLLLSSILFCLHLNATFSVGREGPHDAIVRYERQHAAQRDAHQQAGEVA
jgi:hypothetical protein